MGGAEAGVAAARRRSRRTARRGRPRPEPRPWSPPADARRVGPGPVGRSDSRHVRGPPPLAPAGARSPVGDLALSAAMVAWGTTGRGGQGGRHGRHGAGRLPVVGRRRGPRRPALPDRSPAHVGQVPRRHHRRDLPGARPHPVLLGGEADDGGQRHGDRRPAAGPGDPHLGAPARREGGTGRVTVGRRRPGRQHARRVRGGRACPTGASRATASPSSPSSRGPATSSRPG